MPSSCREDSLFARKICQIVETRPSEFTLPNARQGPTVAHREAGQT